LRNAEVEDRLHVSSIVALAVATLRMEEEVVVVVVSNQRTETEEEEGSLLIEEVWEVE
jgi:hypothetical protein